MKPIFVCSSNFQTHEDFDNAERLLLEILEKDYHVLVVADQSKIGVEFELFNSDLEPKDFEDLKQRLKL